MHGCRVAQNITTDLRKSPVFASSTSQSRSDFAARAGATRLALFLPDDTFRCADPAHVWRKARYEKDVICSRPRRRRAGGRRRSGRSGRHHQGRRAAFAFGHDGDQRDDAEGRHADADRRSEQEGRPARQEARAGGRRSGVELAVVRREGARAAAKGQGGGGVRLLDVGFAQVGAAGVRGAERPAVLPGPVRRRRKLPQRLLYRRRAEPAGDSGGRIPDERRGRRRATLGAARHRLRLSAHHQQDPARLSEVERASPKPTSWRTTRRSAIPTGRRSSPT